MVRFGLPWRLVGTLLTEVVLLFALCCLSRWGSESFDVNAGRGMLVLVDVAAAANASAVPRRPVVQRRVCRLHQHCPKHWAS